MQTQTTAQLIRDEATSFLGRRPTDTEMAMALPRAKRKLKMIISRDGDANGMRRQPWYLGKLVEEAISEEEFSQYTMAICQGNTARRQAAAGGDK